MVHMRSVDAGQYEHIPVLCDEAICHLNVRNGGRYVDCLLYTSDAADE